MRLGPVQLVIFGIACSLVGCAPTTVSEPLTNSQCVDIPNGQFFRFVNGRLVTATQTEINAQETPRETEIRVGATLAAMGYPWVDLKWDGQTVTVSGVALDENARSDAYIATKSAFEADPIAGPLVERVVNEIEVYDTEEAIAIRLTKELVEEDGLGWLRVVIAGKVATLDGVARTSQEKEIGYSIGRSTVESDLDASRIINIVVDSIEVNGIGDPVGSPLIGLPEGATVSECQSAFNQVMRGREVEFMPQESIVKKSSSRLLDAVTGIALLCETHDIEIAGHTGPEVFSIDALELTQRRASSVRDYLMAYGVEPEALTARGYGSIGLSQSQLGPDASRLFPNTAFIVRARES